VWYLLGILVLVDVEVVGDALVERLQTEEVGHHSGNEKIALFYSQKIG
jgi:hypothetical protein